MVQDAESGEFYPIYLNKYHADELAKQLTVRHEAQDKALKNVRDALSWDIMAICIEHDYVDIVEPFFYVPVVEPWYAAGHFPCGWDGDEFPDNWDGIIRGGQLMVF